MAVGNSHLYWTNSGSAAANSGSVWEANLDGTGAHSIVPAQPRLMGGIAVNGSHVYWAASSDFSNGDGAIWEANLDGASSTTLIIDQGNPTGVVVDGTRIYWTDIVGGTVNESNIVDPQPHTLVGGQDNPSSITIGF